MFSKNYQVRYKLPWVKGHNEKAFFVNAIKNVDWTLMYVYHLCKAQMSYFKTMMKTMIDTYFPTNENHENPLKRQALDYSDLTGLIKQQQSDLHHNCNRKRTKLRKQLFCNTIDHFTNNNAKQWWGQVNDVGGLTKQGNSRFGRNYKLDVEQFSANIIPAKYLYI